MTKLMIVESPAKCKKIQSYLGNDWVVEASFGHIRDLPLKEMGVSLDTFTPNYVPNTGSSRTITKLKKAVKSASQVYLATDPDREGEAIAWHLRETLKLGSNYRRVTFNKVTRSALREAVENASEIDFNLVRAQEGRRVLDRLVGYSVTPALSNAYGSWLTAGRVQSVAVRIVVENEIAIRDFVSQPYYEAVLYFRNDDVQWQAQWISDDYRDSNQESNEADAPVHNTDKPLAEEVAAIRNVKTESINTVDKYRKPPPPFMTTTLQAAASTELKLSGKQTMKTAQQLFDNGFITYHRTDNPNLSEEGFEAVRCHLEAHNLGDCVDKINTWKASKESQEGHEAIRPTDFEHSYQRICTELNDEAGQLYRLIFYRTLACQMKSARYKSTTMILESCADEVFGIKPRYIARSRTLVYRGFLQLHEVKEIPSKEDEDLNQVLPDIKQGTKIVAADGSVITKKTKGPSRYTESSLVRKLESEGIGRPSTYVSIFLNIVKKEYISVKKRQLEATELGFTIYHALKDRFSFFELPYTRSVESQLNDMAQGKCNYRDVMTVVYQQLESELDQIKDLVIEGSESRPINKREPINEKFPCECGSGFYQIRSGKKGQFFGCLNYPNCKNTKQDVGGVPTEAKPAAESTEQCPLCSTGMLVERTVKKAGKNKGKLFKACNLSTCDFFAWVK